MRRRREHVALRRIHAELVIARHHSLKAESPVFVRRHRIEDGASRSVHQVYGHALQQLLLRVLHAVAVAVLPDFAAQLTQPHNARVHLGQRVSARHGQGTGRRYAARAGLNAAICHAALCSGECAVVLMRRKAHAVTSGCYAFKDIASVLLGLYRRNDRVGGIQQLDGHIHAVAFFLAEAGVGVVVIVDHAGH